tara:strand:+ start:458 stop:736 length:279 start_codon:yes stop_codon:yes gene_type:complete
VGRVWLLFDLPRFSYCNSLDMAKAVFEDDLSEDTAATCASLRNSTVKVGNRTLGRSGFPRVDETRAPRRPDLGDCLHLHSNPKRTSKGSGMG